MQDLNLSDGYRRERDEHERRRGRKKRVRGVAVARKCERAGGAKQERQATTVRRRAQISPCSKRALTWGACDKAVFCINECKVLLYLFNNKLIIEKKKNYAIIKS